MYKAMSKMSGRPSLPRVLAAFGAAGSLLLASACGSSGDGQPASADSGAQKMGVAVYPGLFLELPVYAAESAGIFTKNGLDADIVVIAGGPNQAAAVSSGDMDTFVFPVNSVLPLRAKGQKFTAVVNDQGPAIYTVFGDTEAVSKCPTAKDPYPGPLKCLKGQSVGVAQLGGDSFVVFMTMLKDAGLAQKDLNLVAVGASSNLANAFKAGQIKFAIGTEPAPTMLEHSLGLTTTLVDLAGDDVGDTFNPWVGETFWALDSNLEKNPEKFQRFKKSITEAIDWIQDPANKDKVQAIMEKDMGFDPKTAKALTENQLDMFTAKIDCQGVENARAFAISTGALDAGNKETCDDITWSGAQDLLVKK